MRRSLSFLERLKLYPLFIVAVVLIAGLITGSCFNLPLNVVIYSLVAFLVLVLLSYKSLIIRFLFLYVSVFLLGIVLCNRAQREYTINGETHEKLNAIIVTSPSQHGKVVRCDIVVVSGKMSGRRLRANIMRDTIEQHYLKLRVGKGLECKAIVAPPKDFGSGKFSYSRYLKCNGISGTAFIPIYNWRFVRVPLSSLSITDMFRLRASQYREKLIERYDMSGLDSMSLALVSAMTLGERSMLSKSFREEFSITGASHVLAMSGLHLSIIYLFLTFAWGKRKRWVIVSLVNIVIIWYFVFIAGLPTSLVRSAIMLTTYCLLSVARRNSQPLNTLSLAALIILIGNPMSVYDVGFQMSFSSVLGIMVLVPWIMNRFGESIVYRFPGARFVLSFITVSCVAQLAVAPLIAYYFGRVSCYFLIANIVVIPCTYIIIVSGMLLLIVPVVFIQSLLASILNWLVGFMNRALVFISSLPGASINVDISLPVLIILYVAIIALIVMMGRVIKTRQTKALY